MSTTKTTTNQYSGPGMKNYDAFQNVMGSVLPGYASNPFGNPFFAQNLSQNYANSNRTGMGAIQNAMQNFNMTGFGGAPSGARSSLLSNLGRYGSGLNANAFYNAANNAFSNQWKSLGTMAGFQPLQTGQTQTTGGLGTWLPQVAGMAISGALGAATGGMSGLGSLAKMGTSGAAGDTSAASAMGNAFNFTSPFGAGPSPMNTGASGFNPIF
jgi:hypothetical protein